MKESAEQSFHCFYCFLGESCVSFCKPVKDRKSNERVRQTLDKASIGR